MRRPLLSAKPNSSSPRKVVLVCIAA